MLSVDSPYFDFPLQSENSSTDIRRNILRWHWFYQSSAECVDGGEYDYLTYLDWWSCLIAVMVMEMMTYVDCSLMYMLITDYSTDMMIISGIIMI